MPIRMDDDRKETGGRDNYPGRNQNNPANPGRGGGGIIGALLPLLLKNPKLLILAAVAFFGISGAVAIAQSGAFSLGFISLPAIFASIEGSTLSIPNGQIIGFLWFFLLFFAALTSSVSISVVLLFFT